MGLVSGQLKKSGFEAACRSAFSISISAQPDKDAIGVELTLRELQSRTAPAGTSNIR